MQIRKPVLQINEPDALSIPAVDGPGDGNEVADTYAAKLLRDCICCFARSIMPPRRGYEVARSELR